MKLCWNELKIFPPGDVLPPSKETDIKLNIRSNLGRSLSLKVMKKKTPQQKQKLDLRSIFGVNSLRQCGLPWKQKVFFSKLNVPT